MKKNTQTNISRSIFLVVAALASVMAIGQDLSQIDDWCRATHEALLELNAQSQRQPNARFERALARVNCGRPIDVQRSTELATISEAISRLSLRLPSRGGSFYLRVDRHEPLSEAEMANLMPHDECLRLIESALSLIKGPGWGFEFVRREDAANGNSVYSVFYTYREKKWGMGFVPRQVSIDRHVGVITAMSFPAGVPSSLAENGAPLDDEYLRIVATNVYLAGAPYADTRLGNADRIYIIPTFGAEGSSVRAYYEACVARGELALVYRAFFYDERSDRKRLQTVYIDGFTGEPVSLMETAFTEDGRGGSQAVVFDAPVLTHVRLSLTSDLRAKAPHQESYRSLAPTDKAPTEQGERVALRSRTGLVHVFRFDRSTGLLWQSNNSGLTFAWQANERLVAELTEQVRLREQASKYRDLFFAAI